MKILLIGDDVQALMKIVSFLAVNSGSHIPRGVQGGTVRFQNDAGRQSVVFEIHHLRAAAFYKESFFPQFVHHRLHFIRIKALSRVGIETDIQKIVYLLHVL